MLSIVIVPYLSYLEWSNRALRNWRRGALDYNQWTGNSRLAIVHPISGQRISKTFQLPFVPRRAVDCNGLSDHVRRAFVLASISYYVILSHSSRNCYSNWQAPGSLALRAHGKHDFAQGTPRIASMGQAHFENVFRKRCSCSRTVSPYRGRSYWNSRQRSSRLILLPR